MFNLDTYRRTIQDELNKDVVEITNSLTKACRDIEYNEVVDVYNEMCRKNYHGMIVLCDAFQYLGYPTDYPNAIEMIANVVDERINKKNHPMTSRFISKATEMGKTLGSKVFRTEKFDYLGIRDMAVNGFYESDGEFRSIKFLRQIVEHIICKVNFTSGVLLKEAVWPCMRVYWDIAFQYIDPQPGNFNLMETFKKNIATKHREVNTFEDAVEILKNQFISNCTRHNIKSPMDANEIEDKIVDLVREANENNNRDDFIDTFLKEFQDGCISLRSSKHKSENYYTMSISGGFVLKFKNTSSFLDQVGFEVSCDENGMITSSSKVSSVFHKGFEYHKDSPLYKTYLTMIKDHEKYQSFVNSLNEVYRLNPNSSALHLIKALVEYPVMNGDVLRNNQFLTSVVLAVGSFNSDPKDKYHWVDAINLMHYPKNMEHQLKYTDAFNHVLLSVLVAADMITEDEFNKIYFYGYIPIIQLESLKNLGPAFK